MQDDLISVLMPVYNTKEEYLKEAIESILNQTYKNFELIILDDGSKDYVEEIIKSYHDERIKFYRNNQNKGLSYTRNRLIDLAQGEFIALMDSDDISLPQRFEKQIKYLKENPDISILGTNFKEIPKNNIVKFPPKLGYLDFYYPKILNSTIMMRSSVKKLNLKYNENYKIAEDFDFLARANKFINMANLQEVLFHYRILNSSTSHNNNENCKNAMTMVQNEMLDFLSKDEKFKKKIKEFLEGKKLSFFEKYIFSIRNESNEIKKYKIITIFGIKLKIKR